jgi:hypothetical protein
MESLSKSDLMHYRLQAWLRENSCSDLEYLGLRNGKHYYRIDTHEVDVSSIESIEQVNE